MQRWLPAALLILTLVVTPSFANTWVATLVGPGAGGVMRVRVSLDSDFERTGCGPAPCETRGWARVNVSPSVFGTTYYDFGSFAEAQAGRELLLWPAVTYSFWGYYAWMDFRPEQGGACAEIDCQGNVATALTTYTPAPLAVENSTWGRIKALFR